MGCHTWYKNLVISDQEKILKKINNVLKTSKTYDWYEVTDLTDFLESEEEWLEPIVDYVHDSLDYELEEVKGTWGLYKEVGMSDEPRIGGYPEAIITSADEMFKAMENGLVGGNGNIFKFTHELEDEKSIKEMITNFFKEYPYGVITFG